MRQVRAKAIKHLVAQLHPQFPWAVREKDGVSLTKHSRKRIYRQAKKLYNQMKGA